MLRRSRCQQLHAAIEFELLSDGGVRVAKNRDGWSQFVYENPPGTGSGALFIQDWVVPTTESGFSSCAPGQGWENTGFGCVQNSPGGVYISSVNVTDHRQRGGDVANFNAGAKIGETNNLFFMKAAAKHPKVQFPSVYFEMASKAGKTASRRGERPESLSLSRARFRFEAGAETRRLGFLAGR